MGLNNPSTGGGTSITNAGGTVSIDGDGAVHITPAADQNTNIAGGALAITASAIIDGDFADSKAVDGFRFYTGSGAGTLTLEVLPAGLKVLGVAFGTAAFTNSGAYDAAGAASSAQAAAVQRANHTGTQALSTISGLGTGVATALAINSGSTGAPALLGGAASFTTLAASGAVSFTGNNVLMTGFGVPALILKSTSGLVNTLSMRDNGDNETAFIRGQDGMASFPRLVVGTDGLQINGAIDRSGNTGGQAQFALVSGGGLALEIPVSSDGGTVGADKARLFAAGTIANLRVRNENQIIAGLGGAIFDDITAATTTHTDGTEDDLFTHTLVASTLGTNGDKVEQVEHVSFVSSATAARRIKKYFGGTLIFDSTALTLSLGGEFDLFTTVIRVSSTVVSVAVSVTSTSASSIPYSTFTSVTGLTLSSTQILKTTGIASGTGAASADIVNRLSSVTWLPAA